MDNIDNLALAKKFKKYLGEDFSELTVEVIIKLTEALNLKTPNGIIRAIKATAELNILVTSAFFKRDLSSRCRDTANIIENIVGKGKKDTPVPYISPDDLVQGKTPEHIISAYSELLKEFYELAALSELAVTILGAQNLMSDAVKQWRNYLFLANGYPDQEMRIKLAQKHVEDLVKLEKSFS